MSKEDERVYTLKQIRIAFSRHLRNGGELIIENSYTGTEGTIVVNWDGFLKELEQVKGASK